MNKNIVVSVICNAYNHENYIRDAIESFLMQKTDFSFEILVHDDASTDRTPQIIREYEAKYPDIIKPIYQKENQYSQGVNVSTTFQYPRVKGKYIAVCEGDDYWTDPYKLQKQYEVLETNLQVDICAHTAEKVQAETKKRLGLIQPAMENTVLSVEDVIFGEGGFVATNSLMYRSELSTLEHPLFRRLLSLDYTLQIHGSLRGGMLYLKDNMSAYRWLSVGSWTSRMKNAKEKQQAFFEKKQQMLLQLDKDTNFAYTDIIQIRYKQNIFHQLLQEEKYREILCQQYHNIFKELSIKERLKIRIKAYFPFLLKIKRKFSRNK